MAKPHLRQRPTRQGPWGYPPGESGGSTHPPPRGPNFKKKTLVWRQNPVSHPPAVRSDTYGWDPSARFQPGCPTGPALLLGRAKRSDNPPGHSSNAPLTASRQPCIASAEESTSMASVAAKARRSPAGVDAPGGQATEKTDGFCRPAQSTAGQLSGRTKGKIADAKPRKRIHNKRNEQE